MYRTLSCYLQLEEPEVLVLLMFVFRNARGVKVVFEYKRHGQRY